jgi:hypothetical protein
MLRLSALLVAAGLSIVVFGCAQCDTCDDFPTPCNGPNCVGGYGMPSQADPVTHSAPPGATGGSTEVLPPPSSPGSGTGSGTVPAAPPVEAKPATKASGRSGL